MLTSRFVSGHSLVRLSLGAAVLLGLISSALILLPPKSRARFEVQPAPEKSRKNTRAEYVAGQVLVRYRSDATAKLQGHAASAMSAEGRAIPLQIERFAGSDLVPGLRLVSVAAADTMGAIAALRQQPDVLYAGPNYIMHTDVNPNDPQFGSLYGLTKIGAPTAWDTTKGSSSIVVGDVDEGIDVAHPDLHANIWVNAHPNQIPGITNDVNGYDFVNLSGTIPPGDHGTHTAGTVGAVGNNAVGVVGVNWNVSLMSLKFLGSEPNSGFESQAIAAYSYAKQMRDLWVSSGGTLGANVRVLNNSYGGAGFSQASLDAITALNQSGILFVAAAGNTDVTTPEQDNDKVAHYPSSYNAPNVIGVAATDSADGLAGFSHFGANSVHLGAPGVQILSTTTNNTYSFLSGTSMATPHVSGAAALLLAQKPDLTVQQLKALLIFNGDPVASLNGKTITGRRLNVANSLAALAANDITPPGTVTNLQATPSSGRNIDLSWTASGGDAGAGTASLYEVSFVDSDTGAIVPLRNVLPAAPGIQQTLSVKMPIGHSKGTIRLREFDNVGNEGIPATKGVTINFVDGNPYATSLGNNAPLSSGGTPLGFHCDDCFKNATLPFSFPFFGQTYSTVTISSNGNIYFTPPTPPTRLNGDADDVPSSSTAMANFRMISGLWDDLYLGLDQRPDADVYMVTKDANTVIFRWQGVPCNDNGNGCTFGGPVNFEVELRSDGTIQNRYGSGNTSLFPVVGISGGEPDPYVITTHTSETFAKDLTNRATVTFTPRAATQPIDFTDFFVTQHYRDFLNREPDLGGLGFWISKFTNCGGNQPCLNATRIDVSNQFFFVLEYQQTGAYVYRMYRSAFGNNQPFPLPSQSNPTEGNKQPLYANYTADRLLVVGGPNLVQQQQDLANAFVQRLEFLARYPANLTLDQFVTAITGTIQTDIGADLTSQHNALVALGSRGAILYRLSDDNVSNPIVNKPFLDAEYNRAVVYTQYAGFLRRNADVNGFLFWLNAINAGPLRDLGNQRTMVCFFLTSAEYQQRFSVFVTHFNSEC